ncbi:MAG TPA: TonB family protein [Smithella sp.]|nr:TonB family protein [Smithella sp.]
MNNANFPSYYSSVMNERYIGIFISLTIHMGFLLLFLAVPAAKIIPHLQTIQISFDNEPGLSIESQKLSAAKPVEPKKIVAKDNFQAMAVQPAHKEAPQKATVIMNSPVIIAEKTVQDNKPVAIQSQNAAVIPAKSIENQGVSQANVLGTPKGNVQQGIVEFKFGDAGSPAFIHQEIPVYPLLARRLGKEGKVMLKLLIDANGKLHNIEVVEPAGFGFTEAAIEAVKKSTYAPGYRNGEKVSTRALLPVRFQLQ